MPDQLTYFDATRPLLRVGMILVLILALVGSCYAVRWYLGGTMAEYLDPEEHEFDLGRQAVSWAPSDPLTHWKLGEIGESKMSPGQLPDLVTEYERAVALSPNDYRLWMGLGIALERADNAETGKKALQQAIALAPSYAYPHWHLGNLLLRSASYDEAFAELRRASEADPDLRPQLFSLAWEVYKQDFESLKTAVGTTAEARAQFSYYLLGRGRFEDGLLLWQSLREPEKRANRSTAEAIIKTLFDTRRYHQASVISNELVPASYRAIEGTFVDGGFEENLNPQTGAVFAWQVTSVQQAQVAIDPGKSHEGSRSLRIVFRARSRLDTINVSQTVLVKPDTQYDFECYAKTENLQSGATPMIEIADSTTGSTVTSEPAAAGSTDWRRIAISFKTGTKTEAVIVRLIRSSCGQDPVCPIFGTVWYDDFNFRRRS